MFKGIDLSSDTVTKPTTKMRKVMMAAEVGDEQKKEDPTTIKLEEMAAEILGFSAALFFPSATMANEVAIRALSKPGEKLFLAENAHIFTSENGGPAVHSQIICQPISTDSGIFTAENIKQKYQYYNNTHHPIASVISVENTTNLGGGVPWNINQLNNILQFANELKLKKHMDGARLFNASISIDLPVKQITKGFDMITICLSKGLGCPVGALLVYDRAYDIKVRRLKHLMGGAMRQSGILAAAGIYALNNHINRLAEDHKNASYLAKGLQNNLNLRLVNKHPTTNILLFEWVSKQINPSLFYKYCLMEGVRFSQLGYNRFRAVTHLDISKKDIEKTITVVNEIDSVKKNNLFNLSFS